MTKAFATSACIAFSIWLGWLIFHPVFLRVAFWNNKWTYDFQVLEDGHTPNCDVAATIQELISSPCEYASETPHWDPDARRCDCRRPHMGAEGGRCASPEGGVEFPTFTMVVALVDLGKTVRSGCRYLHMFKPHLCRDANLVVFCEAWAVPLVRQVRQALGLESKTQVVVLTQQSRLEFYKYLPRMVQNAENDYLWHLIHGFSAGVPQHVVAQYGWITHQKFDFMMQAAETNWFNTSYFVWMDAGAGHGEVTVPQHLCACNAAVPGTATLLHRVSSTRELFESGAPCHGNPRLYHRLRGCALPLDELTWDSYRTWHWYLHDFTEVMGTFFVGDAAGLALLFKDYNATVHKLLDEGHNDYEQAVLSIIGSQKPPYLRWIASDFHGVAHLC